jgi:hypothetical protein
MFFFGKGRHMMMSSARCAGASLVLLFVALGAVPRLARAALLVEVEGNNSLATAQPADGHFSLDPSLFIGDGATSPSADTSTILPHVSITGNGDGTVDYYSFYFPGPGTHFGTIHIDIDFPSSGFDSWVGLWDSAGNLLGHNDDYDYRGGRDGSVANYDGNMSYDSFMSTFLTTPGTYIVGVAQAPASPAFGGFTSDSGGIPASVTSYTLQISVDNVPLPEPASLSLLALGSLLLLTRRR